MKKRYFCLAIFLFIHFTIYANSYKWTKTMGDIGTDMGNNIKLDTFNNNINIVGFFNGAIDFGLPWGASDPKVSVGSSDGFLTTFGFDDVYSTTATIGSNNGDIIYDMCTNFGGNRFFIGTFRSNVDFRKAWGGGDIKTSLGADDVFITKLPFGGAYDWTRRIGGASNEFAYTLASDNLGNIYCIGSFQDSFNFAADFGGSPDIHTSQGGYDIFITKISNSGGYGWTRTLGSIVDDLGYGVITDGVDVYITGSSNNNIYIAKLDLNGNFLWSRNIGNSFNPGIGYCIRVDTAGSVYVAGYFTAAFIDFGSGYFGFSQGLKDGFLLRLDKILGTTLQHYEVGGIDDDEIYNISLDSSSNIYLTGYFKDTVNFPTFSTTPGVDWKTSVFGSKDIFITKLYNTFQYAWTKVIGGYLDDEGFASLVYNNTNIYLTGYFQDQVDFGYDWGIYTNLFTSVGDEDIFLTKFKNMPGTPLVIPVPISESAISLTWFDVPDETRYLIYRNTIEDFTTALRITNFQSNVTMFTDKNLTPDTFYYYWVVASNQYLQTVSPLNTTYAYTYFTMPSTSLSNAWLYGYSWNLVGISMKLASVNNVPIDQVFNASEIGDFYIYEYLPDQYSKGPSSYYQVPSSLQFLSGYWIYPENTVSVQLKGDPLPPTTNVIIPLKPGWNLVATPFLFPCDMIKVTNYTGRYDLYNNPDLVDPFLWVWWGYGYFATYEIWPFEGAWIWANQSCALSIRGTEQYYYENPFPFKIQNINNNPHKPYTPNQRDFQWLAKIGFKSGKKYDTFNFVGSHKNAREGKDYYDHYKSPAVPSHNVRVELGNNLSYDIKEPVTTYKVWEFKITGETAYEDGQLEYDLTSLLSAGLQTALVEKYTGKIVAQGGKGQIQVSGGKYGINKEYLLKVATPEYSAFLTGEVDLINLKVYPNPFINKKHTFLKLDYALSEDSTIDFTLYDVSGQKVFEKKFDETFGFNRNIDIPTDNLSSGTYVYIIKAKSRLTQKEILKKSKLVVIK